MKKTNKKGFTLVEIMIVVAIIGLLAAIGIPSFQKARNNSIEKSKVNNTRLVNAAVDQFAMDNALTDGASVAPSDYATYLKGGTASLAVGSQTCKNPTATVGTEVSLTDMY